MASRVDTGRPSVRGEQELPYTDVVTSPGGGRRETGHRYLSVSATLGADGVIVVHMIRKSESDHHVLTQLIAQRACERGDWQDLANAVESGIAGIQDSLHQDGMLPF